MHVFCRPELKEKLETSRYGSDHFNNELNIIIICFFSQKQYSKSIDKVITTKLVVLCKHSEVGCKWDGVIVDFQVGKILFLFLLKVRISRKLKIVTFRYF